MNTITKFKKTGSDNAEIEQIAAKLKVVDREQAVSLLSRKLKHIKTKEVAEILDLDVMTVRREVRRGNLKALYIGRNMRVGIEELNSYIDRNSTEGAKAA
ncbi:MAG: helix-turn-helix domain-containing protein [Verrucomicrobiales bacterium]|nr:helix-turn-helix domain-containing protein [Verrucomicrobiales bacterium]